MYVLEPIKKKDIPKKVFEFIEKTSKSTSSKKSKETEKSFLKKLLGSEFTIVTKDNIEELKLYTEYYGSISFITDLALDTTKLQKFSFYLGKSGELKIKIIGKTSKDSYTFSPYIYKGTLVSSNAANPVIIRCNRQKTDKCNIVPAVFSTPKDSIDSRRLLNNESQRNSTPKKQKPSYFWFF